MSTPRQITSWQVQTAWGASTGPRTKDGLKRLVASKTKHGRFTKSERAKAKARAEQGRIIRRELKELETWFIDHGHLKKDWRKDLDIFFQKTSLR